MNRIIAGLQNEVHGPLWAMDFKGDFLGLHGQEHQHGQHEHEHRSHDHRQGGAFDHLDGTAFDRTGYDHDYRGHW